MGSKTVAVAALVGIACLASVARGDGTHYFFGGSENTRVEFGTGAAYMGPGNGVFVGTAGDVDGAQRMAVPVKLGAGDTVVTNLAVGLGGQPGADKGMALAVCLTRANPNACGPAGTFCSTASGAGTGVFCQVAGTDTECVDETGYLAVCDKDRLMVKATKLGAEEPEAQRPKWSFQLVEFGAPDPTPTSQPPGPTATPTQGSVPTPTRTPRSGWGR